MARVHQIPLARIMRPSQLPSGLHALRRDRDRLERPRQQTPRQKLRVTAIGLDPI